MNHFWFCSQYCIGSVEELKVLLFYFSLKSNDHCSLSTKSFSSIACLEREMNRMEIVRHTKINMTI